jgi:hypothetical protein
LQREFIARDNGSIICQSASHDCVKLLTKLRSACFQSAVLLANKLEIGSPQVPKFRRVSRRLDDGGSDATQFSTPEDYYRKQYFELIDTAVSAVTRRFDQPGMEFTCTMESIIVTAAQGCTIGVDDDQFQ